MTRYLRCYGNVYVVFELWLASAVIQYIEWVPIIKYSCRVGMLNNEIDFEAKSSNLFAYH